LPEIYWILAVESDRHNFPSSPHFGKRKEYTQGCIIAVLRQTWDGVLYMHGTLLKGKIQVLVVYFLDSLCL